MVPHVHRPALLAGLGPSGSAGPSRRCQGCSPPDRHVPARQAALSFDQPAATGQRWSTRIPTRSHNASRRTITVTKKVPVVRITTPHTAADLVGLPLEATVAMADVAGAMRDGLLAFSTAAGLVVMQQMLTTELASIVGAKHAKLGPDRVGNWHGTTEGQVVLGGRKVTVERPRGRLVDGGEVSLATWETFASEDLLRQVVVERMLAGVATRRHVDVAEPVGAVDAKGLSRSAVSRRFKTATEAAMGELLARDLSELDVAVLMIDGLNVADQMIVVALVITADGTKVPVGLRMGDTENRVVVTDLLADLIARGLRFEHGILAVLDGSKALRAGVVKVFGERALIQRCTLHYAEQPIMPSWVRGPLWDRGVGLLESA